MTRFKQESKGGIFYAFFFLPLNLSIRNIRGINVTLQISATIMKNVKIAQGIAKAMSDFSASRLTNHHVPPKIMEAQNVPIIQRFHFLVSGTPSLKIGRTILYPHYQ